MKKALIVKLSSMGDLVQALPALTDAVKACPGLTFDWLVDESFCDIPDWHLSVNEVLSVPLRSWKAESRSALLRGVLDWRRQLKTRHYDAVLDLQGNIKSAVFTRLAQGPRHGYDSASVRERGAQLVYSNRHKVDRDLHAVQRMRTLMSQSLHYALPESPPDFGLVGKVWPQPPVQLPDRAFLVFVPNASWPNKAWLNESWRNLAKVAAESEFDVLLPWGSEAEHKQAQEIAGGLEHVQVLPRLSLTHIASILDMSAGAVCVDTGLAHISAALGKPTVTLYGPTDPALVGAAGTCSAQVAASGYGCIPCYRKLCKVDDYEGPVAQCLASISVQGIWQVLQQKMLESAEVSIKLKSVEKGN